MVFISKGKTQSQFLISPLEIYIQVYSNLRLNEMFSVCFFYPNYLVGLYPY